MLHGKPEKGLYVDFSCRTTVAVFLFLFLFLLFALAVISLLCLCGVSAQPDNPPPPDSGAGLPMFLSLNHKSAATVKSPEADVTAFV